MTTYQLVLAVAGLTAIVASLTAMVLTRPRPTSLLEVTYLAVPVVGVIALVAAIARV